MRVLTEFFGFTSPISTFWNLSAYLAFIIIIIGVLSEKYRNVLITFGAGVLALYAGIFLHHPLFATLQTLIVLSGILLSAKKLSKPGTVTIMVILTIAAYLFLMMGGAITNVSAFIGSSGLLGIAFGLAALPKRYGFLLMALGGILLIIYTSYISAWVFFFLNIFFTVANIKKLYQT